MFDLDKLIRANIRRAVPYSSARDEFKGEARVFLDANENAWGSPLPERFNRYPDPLQSALKERISRIKGVPAANIFLGNGSDEAIDLLYRAFCEPGRDNVVLVPPTYGMYEVAAVINDVAVRNVPLTAEFQLNVEGISEMADERTKLIFLCSPNNPTGNSLDRSDIEFVLNNFSGIVVIDEAYINFSRQRSFTTELQRYPNLVVLQTFSKAWGMAGLRVGMAFASEAVIAVLNRIKAPYNVNVASQELVMKALDNIEQVNAWTRKTVEQREWLRKELARSGRVEKVFESDANFLLVRTANSAGLYHYLVGKGIVVRDRSKVMLCRDCLRITVGTEQENILLLDALKQYT
ncbi:MAG: histidinol-phosphate transaminase [Bacteroidota bacterium]